MRKIIYSLACILTLTACTGSSGKDDYTAENLQSSCFSHELGTKMENTGDYYYQNGTKLSLYRCPSDEHLYSESVFFSSGLQLMYWDEKTVNVTFKRDITDADAATLKNTYKAKLSGKPVPGIRQYTMKVSGLAGANALYEGNRALIQSVTPAFERFTSF